MKIENLKEFLDSGFYINKHSDEKIVSFRKYGNGFYRFFIGKTTKDMIIVKNKDWNIFFKEVSEILKGETWK